MTTKKGPKYSGPLLICNTQYFLETILLVSGIRIEGLRMLQVVGYCKGPLKKKVIFLANTIVSNKSIE